MLQIRAITRQKVQAMVDTFKAKNGQDVRVRALVYDDAVYLVDIFEHMSSDSRYRRFHQTTDHFPPGRIWREAENIAHMDETQQEGLLAFADLPDRPNAPVGAARYVCIGAGQAETAVSVRDDMQNKGIGSALLRLLAEEAREKGIKQIVADIVNSNKGIFVVLNKLPYTVTHKADGAYSTITIDLTRPKESEQMKE
jgi:GNAT superfamily N-acetyltransferase